ncbi:MAG: hypothetical protein ACD_62C00363G0005 [uncultured bacterium]|nr:MAG: hypothetical protein ACD_62C00363G0005 [uncultured bacterium]
MTIVWLFISLVLLLGLNAFFVLAEFAIVKVRPSRVEELIDSGNKTAKILAQIQTNLDEYLSVCQVGITLASIALGMVGKNTIDVLMHNQQYSLFRYALAMTVSFVLVSGSHIVLGEQVPKYIAIRIADKAALWCTRPLRFFRHLFYPFLGLLTWLANAILRMLGISKPTSEETHSENELRIILDHSQERGMMSFRRLLFMENVFDFGALLVRDAMRPQSSVKCFDTRSPWSDNLRIIRESRFTRYPLLIEGYEKPAGLIHLKDLIIKDQLDQPDLINLIRPILSTSENALLEPLLVEMQKKRIHAALVTNQNGAWTGFITLEDIIEEIVGTIRDEFEDEEPVRLIDALAIESIHLNLKADNANDAITQALSRTPQEVLPLSPKQIIQALTDRGHQIVVYLGDGIGLPHARVEGLKKPFLMFLRLKKGITCESSHDKARMLFVLLTPAGQPRTHQKILAALATLLQESEYVKDRLLTARTPTQIMDVIRTGEQASLD